VVGEQKNNNPYPPVESSEGPNDADIYYLFFLRTVKGPYAWKLKVL
jgi:hypothetical protein